MDRPANTTHAEWIALRGDLDIYAMQSVEGALDPCRAERITIDLHDATLVSAAFLGALVRLKKRLPASRIVLTGVSPLAMRIFRAVKLDEIFEIRPRKEASDSRIEASRHRGSIRS
jgi:anti-anti-sigma factor